MDERNSFRDVKTGRFLPGHPSGNQRLKPGEVIQPHPLYPHLDTKGRVLPGFSLQEGDSYTAKQEGRPFPVKAQELRRALYESASPEDVEAVYRALLTLCLPGEHGYKVQLLAIQTFLDRFFGRPAAQVHVSKEQVSAAVKLDLSALTGFAHKFAPAHLFGGLHKN